MSRPTHFLRHEHRVIGQAVRALEGICLKLQSGEEVPPETLAQLLDFIWTYADQYHHGREEALLFPALEQQSVTAAGSSLGFLSYEHELERRLLMRLSEDIEAYREGRAKSRENVIAAAASYRDHLIRHLEGEDSILFRLAEEILDDETKDALSRSLAQPGEGLSAGDVARYEELAAELERAWAM